MSWKKWSFLMVVIQLSMSMPVSGENLCCGISSPGNPFLCYDTGNCTWYCAYRRPEVRGICTGDAKLWFNQAQQGGLPVGDKGAPGSIAVFAGNHVLFVTQMNTNGTFGASEMGYHAWKCVRENTVSSTSYGGLLGFIFPQTTVNEFAFNAHSPDGWYTDSGTERVDQTQADVNTWMIAATGVKPRIYSPGFVRGMTTNQFRELRYSLRIDGQAGSSQGRVIIRDFENKMHGPISLGAVPADYQYHGYSVNLGSIGDNVEISQIRLDQTMNAGYQHWILDWVRLYSQYYYWDFKSNEMGWTIRDQAKTLGFFDNDFWRLTPIGTQPQIMSPYLCAITKDFSYLGIRYSVQGTGQLMTCRAYFDVGAGWDLNGIVESTIKCDGKTQTVVFLIPERLRGKIERTRIDLFDNRSATQGNVIAINNISFYKGLCSEDPVFCNGGTGTIAQDGMADAISRNRVYPYGQTVQLFDLSGRKMSAKALTAGNRPPGSFRICLKMQCDRESKELRPVLIVQK